MRALRCALARWMRRQATRLDERYAAHYSINVVHTEQIQPDVSRITYDLHRIGTASW